VILGRAELASATVPVGHPRAPTTEFAGRGLGLAAVLGSTFGVLLPAAGQSLGHKVLEAASGFEACDIYRANGDRIELVTNPSLADEGLVRPRGLSATSGPHAQGKRTPILRSQVRPKPNCTFCFRAITVPSGRVMLVGSLM